MAKTSLMNDPQLGSVPSPLVGELSRVAPHLLGASRFTMSYREAKPVNSFIARRWILEIICKGEMEVQFGKDDSRLYTAGQGFVIQSGTQLIERLDPHKEPCQSVTVFYDLPTTRVYQSWRKLKHGYQPVHDPQGIGVGLIENMITHLGRPGQAELLAQGCFYQVMAHLLHASKTQDTPYWTIGDDEPLFNEEMVEKAQLFMRDHLSEPITVADVAEHMEMSVSGFAHRYRREAGESPMVMLRRLRIEAVKMHLMRNRLGIEEIAAQTGFADAFHLSRTFKRFAGVSPSAFRRRRSGAQTVRS